ncbi:MAG: hypothetical protein UY58_C0004G0019 [Candidatus Magasanikbacteria bacterium GW2011_GWA2_50_22]|uniref:SbsA Ig-like domain-containing protein n=1 Tax=Candidatus Magasanikbacteria bacterium GW2011_GWA2_50_22 TaxID=1619043 RepID=A0A0G1WFJ5_9BACT|nr:MAG: hypothetical protein UY58_C0004G0019 [Candidatus Magasanikbacteria bacterium GW2011_GWA2_50_22]
MHQVSNKVTRWFLIAGLLSILAVPVLVLAQGGALPAPGATVTIGQIAEIPGQAGLALPATDIRIIIARIIRVALGFLGLLALILILYGGFLWMTSAGNEEQIGKAKKVLINATIGLVIILSAFAIVQFIIRALTQALSEPPLPAPTPAPARVGGGALGSGMIESHFPSRGAISVPRNTRIVVTFKQDIDPWSIAELIPGTPAGLQIYTRAEDGTYHYPTYNNDGDAVTPEIPALRLKTGALQIIKTAEIEDLVRESNIDRYLGSTASSTDVLVTFTGDLRTFVFTPVSRTDRRQRALLGSATANMSYTVYICGTESSRGNCAVGGIKLLSGPSAFQGYFKDYQWSFEAGTFTDTTPPQILSVVPFPDNGRDVAAGCPGGEWYADTGICDRRDKPRNVMLQVNFNEAVLPTVASGRTVTLTDGALASRGEIRAGSFNKMRVSIAGPLYISGQWQIGNQYRTAEFVSTDLCGRNSCGEDIFCLPGASQITSDVYAATLQSPGTGDPTSAGSFDGIEDVAGNSMDGNRNGRAQGPTSFYNFNTPAATPPGGDNARWSFYTNDTIDLTPPTIVDTVPNINQGGVPFSDPVQTYFSKPMAITSFTTSNITLSGAERVTGALWDTWWTLEGENFDDDSPVDSRPDTLSDGDFEKGLARITHGGFWRETNYDNDVSSRVRDLFQNCYLPSSGFDGLSGEASRAGCAFDRMSGDLRYCCNGAPSETRCP